MTVILDLPDQVLLEIFENLSVPDVVSASFVCRRWSVVLNDNLLWKHLFVRDFIWRQKAARQNYLHCKTLASLKREVDLNLEVGDAAAAAVKSWKSEYARLKDRVPVYKAQVLRGHTDEVLHITISYDGKDMASCSKDSTMIIWRRKTDEQDQSKYMQEDFDLTETINMDRFDWENTWAVFYSQDDAKLLIGGVVDGYRGEVAIYRRGHRYQLMCRVPNDPYDVMGCWISNKYFVSGWLNSDAPISSMFFLCGVPDQPQEDEENPDHFFTTSLLFKRILYSLTRNCTMRHVRAFRKPRKRQQQQQHSSSTNGGGHSRDTAALDRGAANPHSNILLTATEEDDKELKELVAEHDIYLTFICSSDEAIFAPHQVSFKDITGALVGEPLGRQEAALVDGEAADTVVEMHGYVVGTVVSECERYLYVNVRAWPENAVPSSDNVPPISNQVEVRVIELDNFTVLKKVYIGHIGLTPAHRAFYLYLSVNEDFVTSGSEDGKKGGCIWDKHFGCLVSQLPHSECVNCVAFNPVDSQMCVTASDDHTIGIWWSRNKLRSSSKRLTTPDDATAATVVASSGSGGVTLGL